MSNDELERRLRSVETNLAELKTLLKADLSRLQSLTAAHHELLFGNSSHPTSEPGMTVRMDRLESRDAIRTWGYRIVIGASVSSLIGYAIHFVRQS